MNENLLQIDQSVIWHPFTPLVGHREPLLISSASGCYLHTSDGRKILDAISSWWVNLHGHAHPYIARSIAKQAQTIEQVIFAGFTHEPAINLANRLLSILPSNQSKVFFSDNGSTSIEVALKMTFQYFYNQVIKKPKIIAFEGAYHGDTFGAMSVGERSPFNAPFRPYLFEVEFIPLPTPENEEKVFAQLAQLIDTNEVGAFIFEPLIQGASGMRMYAAAWLDRAIALAQEREVICIADEVFTGFGRTGKNFASDYLKHKPDIICLSKGITGGFLPLGVTTCTEKIQLAYRSEDLMKTFFHGHSYTANPLACAAANANLDILLSAECQENIKRISKNHSQFITRLGSSKRLKNIRQLGTILAMDINQKGETSYFHEARNALYYYFLDKNILLRPLGNILYIVPPYIITNEELERIYKEIVLLSKVKF
ncbi:MAG: adenosylmethionine--8-amino-7-oxononanoate transaminase [Thermoflexibacter sp.]|jgi:adenosylmethionine-8-amino-7-oxononanoate aminotransferase|nr:adenosylmethionine--8-amino-7-oxononanoate transaminase [Thermoflexibacter sp.]